MNGHFLMANGAAPAAHWVVAGACSVCLTAALAGCGKSAMSASSQGGSHRSATVTASPSASAATPTVTAPVPSSRPMPIRSADWQDVTVPGSVCGAAQPIRLSGGKAAIPAPPSLHAGTPQVIISLDKMVYGDLNGTGQDVAAADIWCANTSGTADGQITNSSVIYSGAPGALHVLGVLRPRQPSAADLPHVPYFAGLVIAPGRVTAHELWYAAADPTCCPSIHATTVWTYTDGKFSPRTTVQ